MPESRQEVLEYVAKTAQSVLNEQRYPSPFRYQHTTGTAAKQANDMEALRASGILGFEEELVRFLTAERSRLFLSAMCDRVLAQVESLPDGDGEHLANSLTTLRQQIDGPTEGKDNQRQSGFIGGRGVQLDSRVTAPCEICRGVLHQILDFLRQYQYDLSTRPETQEQHRNKEVSVRSTHGITSKSPLRAESALHIRGCLTPLPESCGR